MPLGGFSFDRHALSAVHRSRRGARRQVLALGVVEYLLLAPAACVCALILLLESHSASLALTLPWVFAVPPGFALAWWATQPRIIRHFQRSHGRVQRWIGDLLAGWRCCAASFSARSSARWRCSAWASTGRRRSPAWPYALLCFGVELSVPALVVAYATGYAASRRSLPLGGAGITEVLLTLSLIAVHVDAPKALLSVVAYRLVNFLAPMLPGLLAHSSLEPMLEEHATRGRRGARGLRDRRAGGGPDAHSRMSSSVRPLMTEPGCSATTSEPGCACSSRRLISSHCALAPGRVRCSAKPPRSFSPCSTNTAWPRASASGHATRPPCS